MDGFINLLKPPGMTSSDAVMAVRRLLPRKTAVGHGGTLDPDAAGVLPICVGKATRLFDYIIDKDKTYIGELLLGVRTDTLDASGQVLEVRDVNVTRLQLENALTHFTGEILQVPPMYSALKMGGEPLYKLARKGEDIALEARKVRIHSLEVLRQTGENRWLIKIVCGKGVYIRSLMRDLGDALGSSGCMSFLLRSQAGAMNVNESLSLNDLKQLDDISKALLPLDSMLSAYPKAVAAPDKRINVLNGQPVKREWLCEGDPQGGKPVRLYVGDAFAGMGNILSDGSILVKPMLLDR